MPSRQAGAPYPVKTGYSFNWDLIPGLIQNILSEGSVHTAYCQQLLQVLNRYLERDSSTIGRLPTLICEANNGDPHRVAPVTEAWQLVRLAVKLLDDVEDGDVSNQQGEIINLATGFLSIAQLALGEISRQDGTFHLSFDLCQALNRAMLQACAGQHTDLIINSQGGITNTDLDTWLEIASAKSGEFLGWAAWAGALVADVDEHSLKYYHEYGYHLGVLLQVADDFNGVWNPDGVSDLLAGRLTLPICYAVAMTKAKERDYLRMLLERATYRDNAAITEVQQLLIDMGAQSYMLVVAHMQYQQATTALQHASSASLADHHQLIALLDQVFPALSYIKS